MPSEESFSPASEIRARFKLLSESVCLFQAMDTVLVEVISGTYPFLKYAANQSTPKYTRSNLEHWFRTLYRGSAQITSIYEGYKM